VIWRGASWFVVSECFSPNSNGIRRHRKNSLLFSKIALDRGCDEVVRIDLAKDGATATLIRSSTGGRWKQMLK